jgi:SAM-dependent methyltransferase
MSQLYTSGAYSESNPTWHQEDSPWKALQIDRVLRRNRIEYSSVAEIGCGAGGVLRALEADDETGSRRYYGFDIAPEAIAIARRHESERTRFFERDVLGDGTEEKFDVMLAVDVFEHVPDYIGFLERLRDTATYNVFHIPLDLHVSAMLRNSFLETRRRFGHLHYFTADSALATLRDTGYEILDFEYTSGATELFREHPSVRKLIANIPRYCVSRFSVPLASRWFGGYSLLVLAK